MYSIQCPAPSSAGLVLLISEILKAKPAIVKKLFPSNEGDLIVDDWKDVRLSEDETHNLGHYDAMKREPNYAISGPVKLWECALTSQHYHPSVRLFASSLLDEQRSHEVTYDSDPTVDFSVINFLNRFAYKNPKKVAGDADKKLRRSASHVEEEPVNSSLFVGIDGDEVDPQRKFFHRFFFERNQLIESGKSRAKKKAAKSEDDDDEDSEGSGSGAADLSDDDGGEGDNVSVGLEEEIDRYADKLASDLMNAADKDADIDDDELIDDFEESEEMDDLFEANDDDDSSLGGGDIDDFGGEVSDDEDNDNVDLKPSVGDRRLPRTSEHSANPKKKKQKMKASEASDFANAEDYEKEMDDILREIQDFGAVSAGSDGRPPKQSIKKNSRKNNKH